MFNINTIKPRVNIILEVLRSRNAHLFYSPESYIFGNSETLFFLLVNMYTIQSLRLDMYVAFKCSVWVLTMEIFSVVYFI